MEGGFIVNNVLMEGPVLATGDLYVAWNVHGLAGVTPDSLSLLLLLKPPVGA